MEDFTVVWNMKIYVYATYPTIVAFIPETLYHSMAFLASFHRHDLLNLWCYLNIFQ